MGQHRLYRLAKGLGAEALRESIDRHQAADQGGANRRPRTLQHLEQGVGKGRTVGTLFHQPTHGHRGAWRELALLALQPARAAEATACKEAADPQPTGDVLQMELENREVWVAGTTEGVTPPHRGHHRGRATGHQGGDANQVGVIEVVAGVMGDQIPHHEQAEAGQLGGGARTDAGHLGEGCAGLQGAAALFCRAP